MAGKAISVWLNAKELRRYEAAADKRGLSVSTFLKLCTEEVLAPADPSHDFKQLAADLRADVAKSLARFTETAALALERDRQAQEAFRSQLFDEQNQTVKKAVAAGQGPTKAKLSSFDDFPPSTQPSPRLTGNQT